MTQHALLRVVRDLVAEELGELQRRSVPVFEHSRWTRDTRIGEDGLGFDSLGLLNVAGRINEVFHMHESGLEDYLLADPSLGGWCDIVAKSREVSNRNLTFRTSGSTGKPKICTHETSWLEADARAIARRFETVGRIVTLVPSHHIYGFIYTVLLPDLLNIEVVDARAMGAGALASELRPGDVVVATPHIWAMVRSVIKTFPEGVSGLSSTAPLSVQLAADLKDSGLERMIEIFGSSETSGLGWRDRANAGFTPFDWWTFDGEDRLIRSDGAIFTLGDRMKWKNRTFRPEGRVDAAVQVGGANVFPAAIAARIARADNSVDECAVRTFAPNGEPEKARLKAYVMCRSGADRIDLEVRLKAWATVHLKTAERPVAWTFGDAMPRNANGKVSDW